MTFRGHSVILVIILGWLVLLATPRPASAIPQFARRYKVNCYACHTIPPVLNEQGYMFKRLGHHLPPSLQASTRVQKLLEAVREKEPEWSLTNNASLAVSDFNYSSQRTTQQGQGSSTTSAFQVNSW